MPTQLFRTDPAASDSWIVRQTSTLAWWPRTTEHQQSALTISVEHLLEDGASQSCNIKLASESNSLLYKRSNEMILLRFILMKVQAEDEWRADLLLSSHRILTDTLVLVQCRSERINEWMNESRARTKWFVWCRMNCVKNGLVVHLKFEW